MFDGGDHHGNAGELLTEVIVQIEADAAAFVFGDFEEFVFEAAPFFEEVLEFEVGGFKVGGAFFDAEFEIFMGAAKIAANMGFAQLAFDGGEEASEAIFHDIIMSAGAHGVDGGVVINVARDDNERDVEAVFVE
jgi:hypothetical protein